MSWVAVAMVVADVGRSLEPPAPAIVLRSANFRQCVYCSRFPDVGQREACCRGCGAPLVLANIPAPSAAAPIGEKKKGGRADE